MKRLNCDLPPLPAEELASVMDGIDAADAAVVSADQVNARHGRAEAVTADEVAELMHAVCVTYDPGRFKGQAPVDGGRYRTGSPMSKLLGLDDHDWRRSPTSAGRPE